MWKALEALVAEIRLGGDVPHIPGTVAHKEAEWNILPGVREEQHGHGQLADLELERIIHFGPPVHDRSTVRPEFDGGLHAYEGLCHARFVEVQPAHLCTPTVTDEEDTVVGGEAADKVHQGV
jgi:hypothetical protein